MKQPSVAFSPMHGLAALGAGGLSVSFFVWLMFLTPHPGTPVPTYESLAAARAAALSTDWISFVTAMVGVMVLAHYGLLFWWLRRGAALPVQTQQSQFAAESHIFKMITPLVLAMSVNAGFVAGLVFVPGLWNIKEYLFPFALLAFFVLWVMASRRWLMQIASVRKEGFSYQGKGLIELLATFAFAMISVGFSASAAMSSTPWVHTAGAILAVLAGVMAIWAALMVVRQRVATLRSHPIAATATGSLLMGVPILTILGIATYRLMKAGQHHFDVPVTESAIAWMLGLAFLGQVAIFLFATPAISRHGGWRTLIMEQPQAASFSLICPGVGLFVLGMFFVSNGLIPMGWLTNAMAISATYSALGVIQLLTLGLFIYLLLNAMPFKRQKTQKNLQHSQLSRSANS